MTKNSFIFQIGHYFQGACARAGIDVESGDVVTVCEWSFNRKRDKQKSSFSIGSSLDSDNITKQVGQIHFYL